MKIEIVNRFSGEKEWFEWVLHDGPDGVETVRGYATDLETAFVKVIEWRERISRDYTEE